MKLSSTVAAGVAFASLCSGLAFTSRPNFFSTAQASEKLPSSVLINLGGKGENFPPHLPFPITNLAQKSPSPTSELGQKILQELTECVAKKLGKPQQPSRDSIQAVSMECVLRVVMLNPDGKVRPDANQRMTALLKTTGTTLPKSSSHGQASVKMKPIYGSKVFTVPVTVGGQQRTFLLDTGASNSILDNQIAQQLGLTGTPIPRDLLAYFVVGNDCSKVEATLHSLPPLAVESAKVEGINGMGLPKTAIPGNSSGVLGLDFLKGFDVIVNPKTLELQLLPPSKPVAGAVPLAGNLGVMTTQVKINHQGPFTFLLDTGADSMVVSERLAGQLSLDRANAKSVEVRGFCGREKGRQIQLNQVSLQEHEASQLDAVVLNNRVLDLLGVDGIVGQNFLTRYRQHWRFSPPNELGYSEQGSLVLTALDSVKK